MNTETTKIPDFFLKKELIYFLQNNMKLEITPGGGLINPKLYIKISGETITSVNMPPLSTFNVDKEITDLKSDVSNLISHLMEHQEILQELKKK